MKKIIMIFCTLLMSVCLFTSCSSNTPSGAVKKFVGAMKDGDYAEAVEVSHFSKERTEEQKNQLAELMREKVGPSLEQKGGIDSYTIDSEKISEDGNTAKVVYTVKFGNGEESTETTNAVKVDGDWMVDAGK